MTKPYEMISNFSKMLTCSECQTAGDLNSTTTRQMSRVEVGKCSHRKTLFKSSSTVKFHPKLSKVDVLLHFQPRNIMNIKHPIFSIMKWTPWAPITQGIYVYFIYIYIYECIYIYTCTYIYIHTSSYTGHSFPLGSADCICVGAGRTWPISRLRYTDGAVFSPKKMGPNSKREINHLNQPSIFRKCVRFQGGYMYSVSGKKSDFGMVILANLPNWNDCLSVVHFQVGIVWPINWYI